MSLDRKTPSKDEIRDMITSWQINYAVKIALEDRDALLMIIELLGEKDENTRVRALMALYEVLKECDEGTKLIVLKRGFGKIIDALESGEPRLVVKALKVLSALVDGFPLRKEEFLYIVDILVKLVEDPNFEFASLEMADVVTKLTVSSPSPAVRSKIQWLIARENPRLKAMGLRLLLNVFVSTGDRKSLVTLLDEAISLVPTGDQVLLDFLLDLLSEALREGVPDEAIGLVPRLLTKLKNIASSSDDFFIRAKARKVARVIETALADYYRSRLEEAKRTLNRFLIEGEYEIARDLAISIGDDFLLKWLSKTMEKEGIEEFTPRIEVISSPRSGPAGVFEFSPPSPQHQETLPESSEPEPGGSAEALAFPPLERVVEEGDVGTLGTMLGSNPEVVSELEAFLRSSDVGKRSNALWVLSKLVTGLEKGHLEALHPLIPALFGLLESKNPWERNKAAKILAVIAARGGRRDVAVKILEMLQEKPGPALEFFGYYFLYTWDEEAISPVLDYIKDAIKDPRLQFQALMVLDAITTWGIRPEIDRNVFVPLLVGLIESRDEDTRKLAARIMERFKTA